MFREMRKRFVASSVNRGHNAWGSSPAFVLTVPIAAFATDDIGPLERATLQQELDDLMATTD